jgi:tetratricopeptide (TPR) repeat protein
MEEKNNNKYVLHLGIAEKGKMYAVQGNHKEALRHYKAAIKMTQGQDKGEIFFQLYMQYTLESLELMEAYNEVLNYCETFLTLLDGKEENEFITKYKAETWQRMAIQFLYKDEIETAKEYLLLIMKEKGIGKLQVAQKLLDWVNRGYKISKKQISDLQKENNYFMVTKENINPEIAIELPQVIGNTPVL